VSLNEKIGDERKDSNLIKGEKNQLKLRVERRK